MHSTFLKFLSVLSILLLIGLTSVITFWVIKLYLFDVPDYQAYVANTYKSNQLIGRPFPSILIQTERGDTLRTDFADRKGGLVLLFDPSGCQPCLQHVIKALKHIHDKLKDPPQLPIYAISTDLPLGGLSQYRRAFKLKYQMGIPIQSDDLPDVFLKRTPVVFLINSHNTIVQCHHPLFQKDQFTILFFSELVFNHLSSLQINIDGFDDSPLKQLVGVSLLDVVRGHYSFDDLL